MSKSMSRVLVLAAAALLLVGVCLKTLVSHAQAAPVILSQKDVIASPEYKAIEKIQDESSKTRRLTDEQLSTLNADVDSQHMMVRVEALAALRYADPEHAQAALAIAKKGFASRDGMTRMYALTAMDSLNAPDVVPTAQKMLSDRSRFVTKEAHRILTKRGLEN